MGGSVIALALFLLASPTVALEDYYLAADGADYEPAFRRLQIAESKQASSLLKASGPTVMLECGKTYPLKRTVDMCLPLRILGCGMDSTALAVTGPFSTLISHAENRCPFELPFGNKATGRLTLEGLSILDWRFADTALRYGVDIRWTAVLRDVKVRGFVIGVLVRGDATPEDPADEITNANLSILENVHVHDAQGPGILYGELGGSNTADTNVVQVYGGSSSGNCLAGSRLAPSLRPQSFCAANPNEPACTDPSMGCAGIFDVSFLGGSYTNPHVANSKDITTGQKFSGYVIAGESNRAVLVGPYSESFNCPAGACSTPGGGNYMGPQVIVIGGHSNWVGSGLWFSGSKVNAITARNERDPANKVSFSIGNTNASGALWEMRADADSVSKAWRKGFVTTGSLASWYCERFAENNAYPGICHAGEKTKMAGQPVATAALRFPGPVYFGAVREGRGPLPLPTLDATWPDGSLWRRTATSSSGAIVQFEAQTMSGLRRWVPIARRP